MAQYSKMVMLSVSRLRKMFRCSVKFSRSHAFSQYFNFTVMTTF